MFFWILEKNVKMLKKYACTFENNLIIPVVNAHYTITESHRVKYVNSFRRSETKLLLTTF